MKTKQLLPVLLSALCLCACDRPASPKLYNPGTEPLTADELAWLLKVYHWKITNRVDLIDFRGDNFQPVGAICLEFLHSQPTD